MTTDRFADDADRDDLLSMPIEIKAFDEESRSFDIIASTEAEDAHGDVVKQRFDLKRFKKNPVVLFNHNRFAEGANAIPIGKASGIKVGDLGAGKKALQGRVSLATAEASPLADYVFNSVKQGTLRALSIGFRPGEVRVEEIEGRERYVLDKNELFEISVVPMGSNPEALARLKSLAAASSRESQPAVRGETNQGESAMPPDGQAALATATVELKAVTKERDQLTEKVTHLEAEVARLNKTLGETVTERDKAQTDLDAANKKLVTAEVDALVGKKITPAEREDFIRLATSDHELFEKMIANRPELNLVGSRVAKSADDHQTETTTENGASEGLADELNAAADAAE